MIAESNNRLYRAYRMKEMFRLLLKIKDTGEAEAALKRWFWHIWFARIYGKEHADWIEESVTICKKK